MDGAAKEAFVAGLRAGMLRDEAAAQAGFTSEAFYYARRRDPVFKLAWIWAMELSTAEEAAARRSSTLNRVPGDDDPALIIAPNGNRRIQRRRIRQTRFTDARKQAFLDHFSLNADAVAAAEAAGVSGSTVYKHRRSDPGFAVAWDEALAQAYAQLEAEAVRGRIDAQRRLRADPEAAAGEPKEFERLLQLLARYDRRGGPGMRELPHGSQRRSTFEEAIVELDRSLRALGARNGIAAEPILLPGPLEPGEEG